MSETTCHFGFTKLVVHDLEATANFYKSVCAFTEMVRVQDEIGGRKIDEIIFTPPGMGAHTFVLLKYLDRAAPSNDEVIIGLITGDVDDFVKRALAAGGKLVHEARDMPAHGVRVAFVTDNEGHLLEVTQMLEQ